MIHPAAVIEPGAELGEGVSVGPFTLIEAGARVGDGCVIGPHVHITRYVTMGPRCRVHSGAVLGDLPQDLGFHGGDSFVRIGAECVLREGLTVHRGTKPGTVTEIGDGCFLMGHSHYAHNVKLGNQVIVVNGALLAGYVQVGDRAFISGNAVVHQFVRIGRLAMLGGMSGISKDVPPFFTSRSGAVNQALGVNVVGLRRAGFKPDERQAVRRAFKLLYRSGLNVTDAVARMRAEMPLPPVLELCDFIDQSQRGIVGGGSGDGDGEEE